MNEKLTDRLRKLLNLAGNNPNQQEAEAALKKAQKLALEHGINLARIGDTASSDEIFKEVVSADASRLPITQRFVSNILQKFFNVKIITAGSRQHGRSIYFIGTSENIEFAKYLNSYLNVTFMNLWHSYKIRTNADVKRERESYIFGLYKGLCAKLEENAAKVIAESFAGDADGMNKYQMVLVSSDKALELAVTRFVPNLRNGPKKTITVYDAAMQSGITDGRKINVHSALNGDTTKCLA